MSRILVLESSQRGAIEALRKAGHQTFGVTFEHDSYAMGEAIRDAFDGRMPDLMVADLSPGGDFLPLRHVQWVLNDLWGPGAKLPCLAFLTSSHLALPDLPTFVDDFVLPPFDPRELLTRISMLLFRVRQVREDERLTLADLTVDLEGGKAFGPCGLEISLTKREFELLQFLCTHRGKFFDRDRLLSLVWGVEFAGSDRTVDIHICRLRSKLPGHAASLLETRRGVGYGFQVAN